MQYNDKNIMLNDFLKRKVIEMSTRSLVTAGLAIVALSGALLLHEGQNNPAGAVDLATQHEQAIEDMTGAEMARYFADTQKYYEYQSEDGVVPVHVAFCDVSEGGFAAIRDVASVNGNDIFAIDDITVDRESGTCQHRGLIFGMR